MKAGNGNGKKREREVVRRERQREDTPIDWQEQYELVRRLNDETEKDLQDLLQLKKKSDVTFEQKIKLLDEKLSATIEAVGDLKSKKKSRSESEETKSLRKERDIYRILTGLRLKEESENRYICTLNNPSTGESVKFGLSTSLASGGGDDVEYEPIENSHLLPEFLQSNLAFDQELGPIMLGDMISSLFPADGLE
jgi:hypothetical protein